jgi:hypothetical protein
MVTNTLQLSASVTKQWPAFAVEAKIQGGSNMTGTNCDLFTHKSSRSYLNHLVLCHSVCCVETCVHYTWCGRRLIAIADKNDIHGFSLVHFARLFIVISGSIERASSCFVCSWATFTCPCHSQHTCLVCTSTLDCDDIWLFILKDGNTKCYWYWRTKAIQNFVAKDSPLFWWSFDWQSGNNLMRRCITGVLKSLWYLYKTRQRFY